MRHHPKDLLRKSRPTPSMLVAVLALVVATGGTSYAALSITGKDIKNGSVTGKDVKDKSLTGKDVKNRSLLAKDFKRGQLPAGPKGATGPTGRRDRPAPAAGCSSTPPDRSRPSRAASR